jgi:hypothetical protein
VLSVVDVFVLEVLSLVSSSVELEVLVELDELVELEELDVLVLEVVVVF